MKKTNTRRWSVGLNVIASYYSNLVPGGLIFAEFFGQALFGSIIWYVIGSAIDRFRENRWKRKEASELKQTEE